MHTSDVCQGSPEMLHQNKLKNNETSVQTDRLTKEREYISAGNLVRQEENEEIKLILVTAT